MTDTYRSSTLNTKVHEPKFRDHVKVKAESSPYLHFGSLAHFVRLFTYGFFKKSYNINKENYYYKYLRNNAMFKT